MAKITLARNMRAYDTYEVDLDNLPQKIRLAFEDFEGGDEEDAVEIIAKYLDGLFPVSSEDGDEADEPQYNLIIEEN